MTCPPATPEALCDAGSSLKDKVGDVVGGVKDTVDGTAGALGTLGSWASDPFGSLAEAARAATEGLITNVLPALVDALEPNLSADWFLESYRATFGLAMGVWVLILIWGLVEYGRGKQGPSETADMLISRSAVFLIGAAFGPAVGTFLIALVGALTKGVIRVFVGGSAAGVLEKLDDLVAEGTTEEMIGGSLVAAIIFVAMFLGLFFVVITLLVMLVALYFAGVVFPLGWVWVTRSKTSKKGMKIVWVFVGILLAHPLLFLMLGVSLNLSASVVLGGPGERVGSDAAPDGLRLLVSLLLATIAMWMTAMSPVMLSKFAPILPTEGDVGGIGAADVKSYGSGGSGSGMGNLSQTNASGDGGSGGGDFGGSDILSSSAAGGSGSNTADGAEDGGGEGVGTAAAEGAAEGAEEGAVAGEETGPGAVVTAGAGAAAGATEGVVSDSVDQAQEESGQMAEESSQPGNSAESGDGELAGASSAPAASSGGRTTGGGSGPGVGGPGGLGSAMDRLSDMAVEQMDDYLDPDQYGR